MDWREMEGVAREITDACGAGGLPSPVLDIARAWGFRLVPDGSLGRRRACLEGATIRYSPADTPQRVRFAVAHELAHWALRRAGEACGGREEERRAHYVGGAILLPQAATKLALDRHCHDWAPVVEMSGVSWEAFGRRWVQLYTGVLTIEDDGREVARVPSPWLAKTRPTGLEMRLRHEAATATEHVRTGQLSGAYVVVGGRRRVLTAVALEEG